MKKTLIALSALLGTVSFALAEGAVPAEQPGLGSMIPSIALMLAMVVLFYFMLIRPQKKKDKAVKDMLAALKTGDRVCTIGGIYGTISSVRDDTITLNVGPQKVPMMFARWAIRSVENAPLENDAEPLV